MQKKNVYKFLENGHGACTCCQLTYWKGSVLSGFTIALKKRDNGLDDYGVSIDIPASEIPHLIKIAKKILEEEKNENTK